MFLIVLARHESGTFETFPDACIGFHEGIINLSKKDLNHHGIVDGSWIEYREEVGGRWVAKAILTFRDVRTIARRVGCLTPSGATPKKPRVDTALLELLLAAAVDEYKTLNEGLHGAD